MATTTSTITTTQRPYTFTLNAWAFPTESPTPSQPQQPKNIPQQTTPPNAPDDQLPLQTASPFLRLPGELRNKIYGYLLTPDPQTLSHHRSHRTLYRARPPTSPSFGPQTKLLSPAILATCRQIHLEALAFLYAYNTFAAHPNLLTSYPHLLAPSHPVPHPPSRPDARIRKWELDVRTDVENAWSSEEVATAFSGAEEVRIRIKCPGGGWEKCACGVLRRFGGVRGVGKMVVEGTTGASCGLGRWVEDVAMMDGEREREGESGGDGEECPAYVMERCECCEEGECEEKI